MNSFITRQLNQIKEEGLEAIWRKLKTVSRRFIIFLLTLLAIPFVIIIRLIKPWYWIRFGWFFATKIGHFTFDVEYYLTEKIMGLHPGKATDIFFYRWGKPANTFFTKLTERHLFVRSWAEPLFFANDWLPGGDQHKILPAIATRHSRDVEGLLRKVGAQLEFNNEENLVAHSFLKSIGMANEKFVCLFVRDPKYLPRVSYHNYRDTDIDTYEEAALALAEKGYWVFRMGKIVEKPFSAKHPQILDYANTPHRSDFLDIWLMANCFFCITTGTGLDEVARIFRRKSVYVNYSHVFGMITDTECITFFKHLIWQETNNKLTLSENLLHSYNFTEEYKNKGIKIVDLSQVEIKQAVLEMEARLSGTWRDLEEDQYLQDRFWRIFRSHKDIHKYHGKIHPEARVGAHYLRNNPEWLN
ncbi:TIGR04372 family glycosyltransferase [candidate division KSB1 bacterium]|nr:TIGR04372 family glycosyltransferase [candidate division KSB1 bacterium]